MDETSGVKGDFHAPFCGSPGVRFPRATRRFQLGGLGLIRVRSAPVRVALSNGSLPPAVRSSWCPLTGRMVCLAGGLHLLQTLRLTGLDRGLSATLAGSSPTWNYARDRPPSGSCARLTSPNHPCDPERKQPRARGTPPARRDSRDVRLTGSRKTVPAGTHKPRGEDHEIFRL